MNQSTENREQDNKLIQEITYYASFQPFMGISLSVMSALFLLFRNNPWSWGMLLYIFIPFIGFTAIYAFIAIYMKMKHQIVIPFFNKKIKIVTILLLVVLIGLNLALWKVKNIKFINVSLDNLSSVATELPKSQKYFVLYSSKNCIYCNQMKAFIGML